MLCLQLWSGIGLIVAFIAAIGLLISLMHTPATLGWSLAFVLVILITSLLPVMHVRCSCD